MLRPILGLITALFLTLPAHAEMKIQEVTSKSGLTAWLVEEHSIPFVAVDISFRGGASLDPADKHGVTSMMASLLEEGAGTRDTTAFATRLEELGARFSYSADRDEVSVRAQMLTENREDAVALLRDSLVAPRFDADAVERVRGQMESVIRSNLTDPQQMASTGLAKLVYGDHPYARPEEGTVESVAALSRDDIAAAHKAALTQDRVTISVVGDITAEELSAMLDTLFDDLPKTGGPDVPDATLNLPGGVTVQDYDTPQSVALWVQEGVKRDDPDYFAAYILDHIIGGNGFQSVLMNEVREKRGLTYGVNTSLIDYDHARIWVGSMASANDRVGQAIDLVRTEWQRIHDQGVTAEELAAAKTYLTGAYPLRFDGNANIASILTSMQTRHLPLDYSDTRNAKIEAVTLDDVNRVARERLDPKALTFYVVGQPVGIN